jgi:flagellar hook protein FlgE
LRASTIASDVREMSNVALAQEFTNMIVAQRGFQGEQLRNLDERSADTSI